MHEYYNKEKRMIENLLTDKYPVIGTFLRIYPGNKNNKNEIANCFVQNYNKLCIEYMENLFELNKKYDYGWEFEEYPESISMENVNINDDGIDIDIGYITMLAYGSGYPDPYDYDCVEKAMQELLREYEGIRFEGIVCTVDETTRYKCYDGTVGSKVIGNVEEYGYTMLKVTEAFLQFVKESYDYERYYTEHFIDVVDILDKTWMHLEDAQKETAFECIKRLITLIKDDEDYYYPSIRINKNEYVELKGEAFDEYLLHMDYHSEELHEMIFTVMENAI